jgi:hypothetical protein
MDLIPRSAPHWHLVLNHLPSVGTLVAVCLLAGARSVGSRDLTRASLLLFVVLALVAIPTFVTGAAAGWVIRSTPGISERAIAAHQDAALLALAALLVTGWVAWFTLWRDRRRPALGVPGAAAAPGAPLDGWGPLAVLGSGTLALALMLWTARLGGDINHAEIRVGVPAEDAGQGLSAAFVEWVGGRAWAFPAMETVHFLGMALLFGAVLLTTVRVLGVARAVPYAAFHRLLPLGVFGLVLNVVTGIGFFLVDSGRYSALTYGFFPKMALIVVGGVAAVYFTIFERLWELGAGDEAPTAAKAVAVATVLIWSGVIAYGRLLPYFEGE